MKKIKKASTFLKKNKKIVKKGCGWQDAHKQSQNKCPPARQRVCECLAGGHLFWDCLWAVLGKHNLTLQCCFMKGGECVDMHLLVV